MPILGLTDSGRRFPRIGQLRKGAEKKGNRPGVDLTHFRFVPDNEQDTGLVQRFHSVYGSEPDSVKVYLPYHETHDNFPTWKEHWVAGGLKHRCDGETCVLWLDEDSGTYKQTPKPCPGQCKPVGKLMVIVPALQRFAYVEVPTTSIWDIVRLTENLEAYEAMNGSLQGIPFILSRQPREISTPSGKNGGRARREKWLLHLEPEPEWSRLRLTQMRKQALLPNPDNVLSLPDGRHVDTDTGEILESLDDVDELSFNGDDRVVHAEAVPDKHYNRDPAYYGDDRSPGDEDNPWDDDAAEDGNAADAIELLEGNCHAFATWCRKKHRESDGPATDPQYRYLVGTINSITGKSVKHHDLLAVLVGRPVSSDNPPGIKLASKLLDYLPEEKAVGEGDERRKVPNEDYKPEYAECVRVISRAVQATLGQQELPLEA